MKFSEYDFDKTKILQQVSEEQIFEKYLGEPVSLKKLYKNTNRDDEHPGCTFFIRDKDNRLIFNDHARRMYDCFDFVQEKYRTTFFNALKIIAHDFNLTTENVDRKEYINKKVKIEQKDRLKIKRKLFTKEELKLWSIGDLSIDHNLLQANKIYSIEAFWEVIDEKVYAYTKLKNVFAYHWYEYNYQIYFPLKPKGYRRFINPIGIKWGDLEFLPKTGDHLVITKSKKDAFYLRLFGVNTIFIINEKITIPTELMVQLQDRFENNIFTLFDNDYTGKVATLRYRNLYQTTPLMIPEGEGKDFSDYLDKHKYQYITDVVEHFKTEFL